MKIVNRPLCLAALLLIGIQAVLTGGFRIARDLKPSGLELAAREGENVSLVGTVARREEKAKYQVYYLTDNQVRLNNQIIKESKVLVYIKREESQNIQNQQIAVGNTIYLTGEVSFFDEASNPGNFDMKFYYQKQGIHASIWADDVQIQDSKVRQIREWLTVFRCQWKEVLVLCLGSDYGNIMSGILLGDKSELDGDIKALYQKSGIGHILAVSGLHLSFVGIGIYKILRRITGSYPVGGAFGILFLVLYILMIGLTVSAVRALVMFLFRVGADMTGRHYDAPTALASAAVVTLMWRPLSLYDGGFWLSFGAVFAILAVVPIVQRQTEERFQRNKAVVQGLTASAGINLVLLPVLLYYFFEFPVYSFLLNLFVIPLMSVLLFMGMTGIILSICFPLLSSLCFGGCRVILWLYKINCNLAIMLPGARFVAGQPKLWQIAVYYGILFFVLYLLKGDQNYHSGNSFLQKSGCNENEQEKIRRFRRKKRFALLFWTAGLFIMVFRWGETGKLTTIVLDVGQGDGIFIKGPEGGTYLVDGGSSDVKKVGQYRIEPFLESQGVGTLDYVLVSHGDSDHMNGIEELIERQDIGVKIKTLVLPVQEVWDEALTGLAEKARSLGIRLVTIGTDQSIKEGKMTLTCIQPGNRKREGAGFETGNAASMVLVVKYGEFDMLLTGDVEEEGEEQLTKRLEEQYRDCVWEVLKVAHHGSKNSSKEKFLRQVQPVYAFVSAGRENRYGHPHQETIKRLMDTGSKIYSTQENGAIIVKVEDGRSLKIEKYGQKRKM